MDVDDRLLSALFFLVKQHKSCIDVQIQSCIVLMCPKVLYQAARLMENLAKATLQIRYTVKTEDVKVKQKGQAHATVH